MADPKTTPATPTVEELQVQLAAQKQEAEKAKQDAIAAEKRAEKAEADLAKAATDKKAPLVVIKGTLKTKMNTPDGEVTKTIGFKDGTAKVRNLQGLVVPSEVVFTVANGGKATPDQLKAFPALIDLTKEKAVHLLTTLAARGAAFVTIK